MPNLKIIFAVAALALALAVAWQIGAIELANIEFQDDMQDLASQLGTRIGYSQYNSDDDLRAKVLAKAHQHDIELQPGQIVVEHMGSGNKSTVFLAADYVAPVRLPGCSFTLHFAPSTKKQLLTWQTP